MTWNSWFLETGSLCVALAILELTVDHAGLELTETLLLLPPQCWIKGVYHQVQLYFLFFLKIYYYA